MHPPKSSASWLSPGDTLICFGDSLTAMAGSYVEILQEKLGAQDIAVINAGRCGDKTPTALSRIHPDVIERRPTAVSFFLGTNDAVIGRGIWQHEPRVSPRTYKENLIWLVYLCRLCGKIKKFSIATPTDQVEGRFADDFGDIRNGYALMAREAAEEAGTRLVPLDTAFRRERHRRQNGIADDGLLFTADGTHMNPEGNRLIAETMLAVWQPGD